jgi:glucan phosphoethanolaminetransferase (alkaline phosphatase superfamily)
MAVAEAAQSRHPLRAGGVAATLVLAKAFALAEHGTELSLLSVIAYLWQDFAVAIAFWAIDVSLRRPRWLWIPYAAIAACVVINIPVIATLGSPLTPTMIRAAGAALGNSMQSALTLPVLVKMCAVMAVAIAGPRLLSGLPRSVRQLTVPAALLIAAAGAAAVTWMDTNGLHRNAVTALLVTATPRVGVTESGAPAPDFRSSPFGDRRGEDLTRYRGRAKGFNVVLVALESTAARYLKPYGAADDPTPSLTALARESLVFDAAYAAYPESVKGLFAVLCSMAPALDVPAEPHARAPCDSVVTRLGQSGYRTGLFHAGRFTYLGMQEIIDVHRFDTKEDAGAIGGRVQSSFGVDEPAVVSRVLKWIDDGPRDRPFFLTYLPAAGHHPYASSADGPFPGDTSLGAYKNAINEGDRALGTLFDGLRARGLFDRTLIVVFGDHGEAFDQHPGNRAHSLYIYDENVKVPLVIRLPGEPSASGARVARIASVIDIGPTILDLTGAPAQQAIEGGSLLEPRGRMALFHADYDRAWLGLRDGCWKFLLDVDAGRARLFDVCADPAETRDRAAEDPARSDAYRTRVTTWAASRRAVVLGATRNPRPPE